MARTTANEKVAAWAGFDLSTTGLAVGVRSRSGLEDYAQVRMQGATTWQKQPAFDLAHTPQLLLTLLDELAGRGWSWGDAALSFAVRQHDMVLLDAEQALLMPALSWQCHAAREEVLQLQRQGAEAEVGRVEERFILPKLMWALRQAPQLKRRVAHVLTTGDWIAYLLTGKMRLSTSDALSNGLLVQRTKRLADAVLRQARLVPEWFPTVIQSGRVVGRVSAREVPGSDRAWGEVRQRLAGAQVVSSLGDNHATGVGCGLTEHDFATIVVSAGTSGTINRVCPAAATLAGHAACFEYYKNRLLLMMLADCCKWYDRFVARDAPAYAERLADLDARAAEADLARVRRVLHHAGRETYPPDWSSLDVGQQAASTQLSIMLELLLRVRAMLAEVPGAREPVSRFVLTGGLSQSRFCQQVFHAGIQLLAPQAEVLISARQGPLRYQTAAYGALLNAMRPADPEAATRLCPTHAVARADAATRRHLQYLLQAYGLQ